MDSTSDRVVIGMDPHKRSATIEVMTGDETIVGAGRSGTCRDGYAAMTRYAKQWHNRIWAVKGCQGIGRHIANRLLADGEHVVDVPPKLSARRGCSPPVRAARPTPPTPIRSLGGHSDGRAAPGGQRRAARGAADSGRPSLIWCGGPLESRRTTPASAGA